MNSVKLTFVGDLFPGNIIESVGIGIGSQFLGHKGNPWQDKIKNFFLDSDFVFANLESPLIKDDNTCNNSTFAGSTKFAKFLSKVGISAVSVANNHILEHGSAGFQSTLDSLKENNIFPIGFEVNGNSNIQKISLNNINIGMIGYNSIHDIQNKNKYATYSEERVVKLLDQMNIINLDYKIVSIHWGDEYVNIPSSAQIEAARRFIDNGADMIIGHHPHAVQPFEKYKHGVIFYSLGNFMSDMIWNKNVRTGAIANITLNKDKILKSEMSQFHVGDDFLPNNYCYPKSSSFLKRNTSILNGYSENNKDKYDSRYKKIVFRRRVLNRIWMKKILLKNWSMLPNNHKIEILRNIKNKIGIWN